MIKSIVKVEGLGIRILFFFFFSDIEEKVWENTGINEFITVME